MEHNTAQEALEATVPIIKYLKLVFNPTWSEIEQLKGAGRVLYFVNEYICRVLSLFFVVPCIIVVSLIPWQRASRMLWWMLYLFGAAHFEREMRIELGIKPETHEPKVI